MVIVVASLREAQMARKTPLADPVAASGRRQQIQSSTDGLQIEYGV